MDLLLLHIPACHQVWSLRTNAASSDQRQPACCCFSLFFIANYVSLPQYAELAEGDREAWAKEQGADSALPKIITTGFKAIHLIYFFTAGADEVKCWQIRKGSKAPQVRDVKRPCSGRRRLFLAQQAAVTWLAGSCYSHCITL
jgi:hypothetical protein